MMNMGKEMMGYVVVKAAQEKACKPIIITNIIGSGKLVLEPGIGQVALIVRNWKFTFGRSVG